MTEYLFEKLGPNVRAGIWNDASEPPFKVQRMNQVHGTTLVEVNEYGEAPEADALVTRVPGLRIAVKTADCIPLVFVGDGFVAVVHAGWRGLTSDIIPNVLAQLGPVHSVAVGPSLGVECAEFSDPHTEIPQKFHWAIREKQVDLNAIARRQLEEAGITNTEWLDLCTCCDSGWPSWRRDQTTQRFLTWAELIS